MISDSGYTRFPLWLELSGLPMHLNEIGKSAYVWTVFKKIVELDCIDNPTVPGYIDVSMDVLAARTGLDHAKIQKSVKAMRKAGVVRAFLPEENEENALFQIITPIPVPTPLQDIRDNHLDLFIDSAWPPRYGVAVAERDESDDQHGKVKRVADLYMNIFSMRMNPIILDQLQMISDRYDEALIEKVFHRAVERGAQTLSFILSEIRREMRVKLEAEKLRRERLGEK